MPDRALQLLVCGPQRDILCWHTCYHLGKNKQLTWSLNVQKPKATVLTRGTQTQLKHELEELEREATGQLQDQVQSFCQTLKSATTLGASLSHLRGMAMVTDRTCCHTP